MNDDDSQYDEEPIWQLLLTFGSVVVLMMFCVYLIS